MRTRISNLFLWIYIASAGLFLAGVLVQVFLAGLVVVARRAGWDNHTNLGHSLGLFLILMLIAMFPARIPANGRWLTALLIGVYFLQTEVVIFMRETAPYAAALHPVLALFDFLLAQHLVRLSVRLLRGDAVPPAGRTGMGKSLERGVPVREV
ncbi:MAG TPA: DUF6220 domain-containing protein [Anaerolineales bacterium]|nr:DUF6220 domain-containing protein [Anaerolineales bacterium]